MCNLKKLTKAMALALALTMAVPAGVPYSTATVAEAATVKLSATKKTLTKGKSFTLTVKGTKKKATWKSSKKTVATVNSKGKVTAKKAGTATISAKVGTKTYKCKVTVKNPVNKYVAKAPFAAKEVKFGKYTAAMPKAWTVNKIEINGVETQILMPKDVDPLTVPSTVSVASAKADGAVQENFDLLKEYLSEALNEDTMKATLGESATIKEFSIKDETIKLGKAMVITYAADIENESVKATLKQKLYYVFDNGYITQITVTDYGTGVTPDIYEVGKYLANSLIYNK